MDKRPQQDRAQQLVPIEDGKCFMARVRAKHSGKLAQVERRLG
jgi:hypothetical protein